MRVVASEKDGIDVSGKESKKVELATVPKGTGSIMNATTARSAPEAVACTKWSSAFERAESMV